MSNTARFDNWYLRRAFAINRGRVIKWQKQANRSYASRFLKTLKLFTAIINSSEEILNVFFLDTVNSWKYIDVA